MSGRNDIAHESCLLLFGLWWFIPFMTMLGQGVNLDFWAFGALRTIGRWESPIHFSQSIFGFIAGNQGYPTMNVNPRFEKEVINYSWDTPGSLRCNPKIDWEKKRVD